MRCPFHSLRVKAEVATLGRRGCEHLVHAKGTEVDLATGGADFFVFEVLNRGSWLGGAEVDEFGGDLRDFEDADVAAAVEVGE